MPISTKNIKKFALFLIFSSMLVICLTSCAFSSPIHSPKGTQPVEKSTLLLDTVVNIRLYGADGETASGLIDRCFDECRRYEAIFSRTDENSELYALNRCGSMAVSDELLTVLTAALDYCELSGGAFDITLGAVSDLYAFSSDAPQVPSPDALAEALSHTGYEKIKIEGNTVTLTDPEAVIDLGAIAKGYIADRLGEFLRENGQESAIISLGGNILCVGGKQGGDFSVGIRYPTRDTSNTIAAVAVSDRSVVTSGIYERSFEKDGVLYHHILSSETGLPCNNSLLSVSIVSDRSVDGDALSTVCFALGVEDGLTLIDGMDGVYAVFVTEDLELHYSDGFEKFVVKQ